jgi:uncharacterized protein
MPASPSKPQVHRAPRRPAHVVHRYVAPDAPPPTVSGRWLLAALGITIAAAVLCYWGAICLLFWQGSWQLLYHPNARVAHTPAEAGLSFDDIAFAVTESGQPLLTGWWIPANPATPQGRFTVLYLHGGDGNLGDTVAALTALHTAGVDVFAYDPRGYGQSVFTHPSEASLREDAESALAYLTGARHVAPSSIVLCGQGLGADLALETAAAHPELAGVIVRDPIPDAANAIFADARAHFIPARLFIRDRYDLNVPLASLRIPSLWLVSDSANRGSPQAVQQLAAARNLVRLPSGATGEQQFSDSVARWIASLGSH